jgi:hypothetical protein
VADDAAGGLRTVALTGSAVAAPAPPAPAAPAPVPARPLPALGVAGQTNRAAPVTRLTVARTLTRARLRRNGLRVTSTIAAGVRYVRISVFRVTGNRRARRPLWVEIRRVRRPGVYRAVLGNRRLIRLLRTGTYQVEVRTGRTRATLGRPVTTRFRVTR